MKKKILFFSAFSILFVVLIFQRVRIQPIDELYVRLFKKSAIFDHFNNEGQLDGDYISFVNGKIYVKSKFKDGLRQGLCVWYNEKNGKKEHVAYYKNGKVEGKEYQYYENGKLNYSCSWKNNKRYGSLYRYSKNGKLNFYATYDLSGRPFFICKYNKLGRILKMSGLPISPVIYVFDSIKDSTVSLKNNGSVHKVKDLYVTVATPPGLSGKFNIIVNNVPVSKYKIENNTIIIKNIFSSLGSFMISFDGEFVDYRKKIIRSPRFEYKIISN